jgi:hypothetical protein
MSEHAYHLSRPSRRVWDPSWRCRRGGTHRGTCSGCWLRWSERWRDGGTRERRVLPRHEVVILLFLVHQPRLAHVGDDQHREPDRCPRA